jgi:hypothetical protein
VPPEDFGAPLLSPGHFLVVDSSPMLPDSIAEAVHLAGADILAFGARMREVIPAYRPGDRVELHGEKFEVSGYHREGMPGYWLKLEIEEVFWLEVERSSCFSGFLSVAGGSRGS